MSSNIEDPTGLTVDVPGQSVNTSKPCPWGQPAKVTSPIVSPSLKDIMSEQLAASLEDEEHEKLTKEFLASENIEDVLPITPPSDGPADACSSDLMIAHMLQMQFNKEYDEEVKRREQKFNGASKVDSDSEEEDDSLSDRKAWDSFEAHEKAFPMMSKSGYVKINSEVVTKHDVTMSSRRNACKVMEFPPGISTGDGASFDMQLSNKVYNSLKVYSKAEESRRTRLHDKVEKSTSEMALDSKTRLLLYKLVNNSILDKVFGIISTGKEAVVLYATGGNLADQTDIITEVPEEVALKVFKTTLNEFKTRDKYIKDDYRFKERFSKQNPRKIIHLWAEKEMHNLNRMKKAGIMCPNVVLLKKHILLMTFIGKDGKGAPMLKDVRFSQDNKEEMELLQSAMSQTITTMHKMYKECNLIHGDLSEFNILWHENSCYFIDVSQSVEPYHPHGLEFLYRDCTNISNFFSKRGAENVPSPEELFTDITGFKLEGNGAEILNQVRDYEKNVELLTFSASQKSYPFEHCWKAANVEKSTRPADS